MNLETKKDSMLGLIVQKMPGVDNDRLVDRFYDDILESNYWGSLVNGDESLDANKFVELVNDKFDIKLKRYPLDFYCRCNKESFSEVLNTVNLETKAEEDINVSCHYCNKKYTFDIDELNTKKEVKVDNGLNGRDDDGDLPLDNPKEEFKQK